jgi:uncharacterized protein with ATP-grasp and redox domains
MHQALRAGRMATNDEQVIKNILDETGDLIKNIPMQNTPAETGMLVYNIVKKHTGVYDPYAAIKSKHIEEAKAIYPELIEIVNNSDDKLLTAIRIAIAGNVIDLGINKTFNIVNDVKEILTKEFAVFDYQSFKKQLSEAKYVLYLADNAGESVFDKILIQQLQKPVYYAVRSKPIINDVTKDDAIASGVDEVAEIVDSGSEAPGTILNMCTPEFRKLFDDAGLIISKGQGNYEGLSDCNRRVFFLLKAKCKVISDHLLVKEGSIVLKEHKKINVT